MRHLLEIDDLNEGEITGILSLAEKRELEPVLKDKGVVLYFEKPSLRTRQSCSLAASVLGASVSVVAEEEVGFGWREDPVDIGRTLARYNAIIGMRVKDHGLLEKVKDAVELSGCSTSVVNLLSDKAHPCQALADMLTIRQEIDRFEVDELSEVKVAFVGDANNVCRSFCLAACLLGMEVHVANPPAFSLDGEFLDRVSKIGAEVRATSDPREAVAGVHVIYTDTWVSMGEEDRREEKIRAFEGFQVNEELVSLAAPNAIVLHCLPAHKGEEISESVFEANARFIFKQAENRFHTARALFWWLATVGGAGSRHWPNIVAGMWRQEY